MPAKPKTIDDYLARVSAHVQENVAFPGLVSAVNRAGYRCRLANMMRLALRLSLRAAVRILT